MDPKKGTLENWFIVREADCSSDSGDELEISNESEVSDLIDNTEQCQENSLQLYQQQQTEDDERNLTLLKRKFVGSPKKKVECELSPSLREIHISPEKHPPKRRLFQPDDSGIELNTENEADFVVEEGISQVTVLAEPVLNLHTPPLGREDPQNVLAHEILKSSNRRATQFGKFKEMLGVGFSELTRDFKNDQTCTGHWVAAIFDVFEDVFETCKLTLKPYVTYYNLSRFVSEKGSLTLLLSSFKVNKSRLTVHKLLQTLFQVEDHALLTNPPRLRSAVTACFWFKRGFASTCTTYGEMPEWLKKQIIVGHRSKEEAVFSLTNMVQWAWDNDINEESVAAYEYAKLANEDPNAAAFLNSNSQPKHVKDCISMVRMYRTAEMRKMSMSAWIDKRCSKYLDNGDWKQIVKFLKYQTIEMPVFINCLKACFKKVPKKSCIVIYGPSNTGKSTFLLSLMRFLQGAILSFVNFKSHFWLSPLTTSKVALIDDATHQCWDYMDTYMRNALDGSEISVDLKHRNHVQILCPPLFISTNCDLMQDDKWKYIRTRVSLFNFPHSFPLDEQGNPVYLLNEVNWKSFFRRLWSHLELSDQEEESEDGQTDLPFRLAARGDS